MTPAGAVPRLHLVTSTEVLQRPGFESRATELLEAMGAVGSGSRAALHLRGRLPARHLLDLAAALRIPARAAGVELWVNDRVDIARMTDLDGVQLPSHGFGVEAARELLPGGIRVGASVHDLAQSRFASGADLWIAGNIWETTSHPGRPAAGAGLLMELADAPEAPPIIAIGGLTPERVGEAIVAGSHGVAVLSGIWSAPSPREAAIRYLQALSETPDGDPA